VAQLKPSQESTPEDEAGARYIAQAKERIRTGLSKEANARMGIPERYTGKKLSELHRHSAEVDRARRLISENESVTLSGPTGVGKTHLGLGLLCEFMAQDFDGILVKDRFFDRTPRCPFFISAIDLLLEFKHSFNERSSELEVLVRYRDKPLLMLDDLGAEAVTDYTRATLYALLDHRYKRRLPTIVTSNLDLAGISERIDDRIASRLNEMGEVIQLQGHDWRTGTPAQQEW